MAGRTTGQSDLRWRVGNEKEGTTAMEGEEFLRRMLARDPRVFDDLMPTLERVVNGACAAFRMFDPHQRQDVLQEVAVKVFSHWQSYQGGSRLATWLYAIARNACLDELRRRRRHAVEITQLDTADDPVGSPLDTIADVSHAHPEQSLCVQQVLAELEAEPPARKGSMRKIDVLRFWVTHSPTTEQLAAFLNTTLSAATTRKSAIAAAVRALCQKYCGQEECAFAAAG